MNRDAGLDESRDAQPAPARPGLAARVGAFLGVTRANLLSAALTAIATSFLTIVTCVSYPAVIFTGPLEPHFATGIGIFLASAIAVAVVLALFSTLPGALGYAQSDTGVVVALIAASTTGMLQAAGTPERVVPTLFAVIAASAFLTGAFFALLGQFRLGNLIRYIPFPVIGGFLAGIGWLLVKAAIASMTGMPVRPDALGDLAGGLTLAKWLPGVAGGVLLWWLQRWHNHVFNMPAVLAATVLGFWAVAAAQAVPADELTRQGWLIGPLPAGSIWSPLQHVDRLNEAALGLFPAHAAGFATVLLIASVAFLLNATSVEIAVRRDIDLNHELKVNGLACLASGLAGGLPGYLSLSGSVLTYRLDTPIRLVGLLTAAICLATLAFGIQLVGYLPRLVIGNILVFMAVGLMVDWLYLGFRRMPTPDYAVLLLVFAVVVTVGFMEAIAIGTVAGVVMFAVRYSRISVARNILSGADFHSNVERAEPARQLLAREGGRIFILKLQGFIFFGTANSLIAMVSERLADAARAPIRYLVIDFRLVTGMDASAAASFTKLSQYAEDRDFFVVFTGLPLVVATILQKERVYQDLHPKVHVFADLDHGLEWCEEELILNLATPEDRRPDTLVARMRSLFEREEDYARFLGYFDMVEIEAGGTLLREGAPSDDFYFIESGVVTVAIHLDDGSELRLKTMGPGTVVGEVGFYLATPRSASVVAGHATRAFRLTRAGLAAMKGEHPELASILHEAMARMLSSKLIDTNRLFRSLNV